MSELASRTTAHSAIVKMIDTGMRVGPESPLKHPLPVSYPNFLSHIGYQSQSLKFATFLRIMRWSISVSCFVLWSLTTEKFVFLTFSGNNLLLLEILNHTPKKKKEIN